MRVDTIRMLVSTHRARDAPIGRCDGVAVAEDHSFDTRDPANTVKVDPGCAMLYRVLLHLSHTPCHPRARTSACARAPALSCKRGIAQLMYVHGCLPAHVVVTRGWLAPSCVLA
jgi:hypothetical protein